MTNNILRVGEASTSFVGTLARTDWHQHGAIVLLTGLSGPINVITETGEVSCRSAVIDAGMKHILDSRGEDFSANYFEVDSPQAMLLRHHFLGGQAMQIDLVAERLRSQRFKNVLLSGDVDALVKYPVKRIQPGFDQRITQSIAYIKNAQEQQVDHQEVADQVALSPSRFRHLFKSETGLPFQRYRLWQRLAHFVRAMQSSRDMTRSAHAAGFYDSSHLGHSFKKLIGLNPSQILNGLTEFELE